MDPMAAGNNETKVYDLTGAIQADAKGAASAKRLFRSVGREQKCAPAR
jgi:hypothetical protein